MYALNKQQNSAFSLGIFLVAGLFFLLCSLCASCENEKTVQEKPDNLLELTAFESILCELYLIEGNVRFHLRNTHFDTLRTETSTEVNVLYKKYNLNHEQFLKNYTYYMNNPNLSTEIMKNITNRLVELQAKEEAKPDTLISHERKLQ